MSQATELRIKNLGKANILSPLLENQNFISDDEKVIRDIRFNLNSFDPEKVIPASFEKSGPRKFIYFKPSNTKVGIVTCGGLCPGLNAVIRGLVRQLHNRYGVKNIMGVKYGYHGLGDDGDAFVPLTPDLVEDIHQVGGSILGSSRGAPPVPEMVENLRKNNINILFAIGGDGTMRGANALVKEIEKTNLKISVIGIPKTIDNDIPFVMKSFGFETAVEKASDAIYAAHEEARGHLNGIGLIKVMGRHTGFIAATSSLATGVVNYCLVPEISFNLEGKNGLFNSIINRFKYKKHAVIVVAEGTGMEHIKSERKLDASGNVILPDIGIHLKNRFKKYFEEKNIKLSLKYIDPSYIIRSSPPNSFDRVFCSRMAQNAVHAAMAGKTAMVVGNWHEVMTHIPFDVLSKSTKSINPKGTLWFNVLESTTQENLE